RRGVANALGLTKSTEAVDRSAFAQIDHVDRVVTQLGDEEAFAADIDRHVVDPSADVFERNRPLEKECRFRFRCNTACGWQRHGRQSEGGNDPTKGPLHFRLPPSSLVVRALVQRSGVAFQFSFSEIVEKSLERSKTMVATG